MSTTNKEAFCDHSITLKPCPVKHDTRKISYYDHIENNSETFQPTILKKNHNTQATYDSKKFQGTSQHNLLQDKSRHQIPNQASNHLNNSSTYNNCNKIENKNNKTITLLTTKSILFNIS